MRWNAHPPPISAAASSASVGPAPAPRSSADQVEVAAQRVPEVVALLGRVDVGHQVGGEEQGHPADQRGADRDRASSAARRPGASTDGQQHRGGQAEQAARHLAGQPGRPVLAQQGQVGGRAPAARAARRPAPAQPLGGRRTGGGQARPESDSSSRASAASTRGPDGISSASAMKTPRPASAPTTTAQVLTTASLIPRRPRVPRRPAGAPRAGGRRPGHACRPGTGRGPASCRAGAARPGPPA